MSKVPLSNDRSPLAGPIALVTTVDGEGRVNIAPKSWISHVCRRPPLLVLGCHREHHTAQNLLEQGECVLNFPSDALAGRTWAAHRYLAPTADEPAIRGFTPIPAEVVAPPRLKECPAHIEGRVESVRWYGDEAVFFIEEVARSVDARAAEAPDLYAVLRPIFFLAGGTYGTIARSARVDDAPDGDDFRRYVILLRPRTGQRPDDALIRAHVAHLRRLDAAGRLVLAGPFGDGAGGMIIIRADSLEEARALAEADPFVTAGYEECEVRAWDLSCEANDHMGYGD